MKHFKSTITALVTPFKGNEVDKKSFEKLMRQQMDGGIEGFVINGTTAESPTLLANEKKNIFEIARSYCGKDFPLIMGTGSNSTFQSVEATREAEKLGADAALVVVPYYNKPPQRGLYEHFKKVAESTSLPVILYNVPGRTVTALSMETIQALTKVKNIVGIKEASGKIEFAQEIHKKCGDDFDLLSGDDGTYVEFLKAGGHGVISVASHVIPKQMVQWKKWMLVGEVEKARADIKKYSRLIDLLFVEANPIPVKKALQFMNVIETADLRLPMVEMDENLAKDLHQEMEKVGIL